MEELAYLDRTVTKALEARLAEPASDEMKKAASGVGKRVVAGFELHDDDAERAELDRLIGRRNAAIERFHADRRTLEAKLPTPALAIVPTIAWNAICMKTRLFRLAPDATGQVRVLVSRKPKQAEPLGGFFSGSWTGIGAGRDVKRAEEWHDALLEMLPGYQDVPKQDARQQVFISTPLPTAATVILPQPPADVAAKLIATTNAGLKLKVAAEAGAIGFKESLGDLRKQALSEEARRIAAMADPIIYTEEGTATAIIAQFGDFPIERAVVEAVVSSANLVPDVDDYRAGLAPADLDVSGRWHERMIQEMQKQTQSAMTQSAMLIGLNQLRIFG